ncbi:hypothetical protein BDFG_08920 [Blastomyces dermatitidis ATCC 26199]|nr:hypothetical protein BDFG_08920 [Blastomyces dermatitidis ATCC 26199]
MWESPEVFGRGSLIATEPQKSIQWPLLSTGQHGHKLAVFEPTRSMDRVPWNSQAYELLTPAWQPRSVNLLHMSLSTGHSTPSLSHCASDHMM